MPGIHPNPLITLIGGRVRASFEDDFLKSDSKISIEELVSLNEEGTFVISASIQDLLDGEDGWDHACKCHRTVSPDSGSFYCTGCVKHVCATIPRYVHCLFFGL
jgi:hypothetical protein